MITYQQKRAIADALREARLDNQRNRERMQHLIGDQKRAIPEALEELRKRIAEEERTGVKHLYGRIRARNQREFEIAVARRKKATAAIVKEARSSMAKNQGW